MADMRSDLLGLEAERLRDLATMDDDLIADAARRLIDERMGIDDPLARFDAGF